MVLIHLHVDGFGRLANLDLDFADGINLICGDNEAGKSTLCSFIFHMLYGMERGRGKASRFDSYTRFLPWCGAGYGGSLTFEAQGCTWLLERSFLAENRFLRLIRLDDGMICSDAESLLGELRGHVIALDYQTLFMFSQQNGVDLSTLSTLLRQYTQNLPGSRSVSFSASSALKSLNRQKKEFAAQLSGYGKGDLYRVEAELSKVRNALQDLTSDLIVKAPDERLEDIPEESLEELLADGLEESLEKSLADGLEESLEESLEDAAVDSHHRLLPCLFAVLLFLLSAAGVLYPPIASLFPDGPVHFLPSALCFAGGLFALLYSYAFKRGSQKQVLHSNRYSDTEPDCSASTVAMVNLLLEREEILAEELSTLAQQLATDEKLRQNIDALRLATDTISALSADIHQTYSPDLQRTFARHASMLTGRPFSQIMIDENFRFSLLEEGHIVPLEALSRGTVEQLILSCRLASVHLLYPNVSLPLLMDDIFALTDDSRLSVLLLRLSLDHPGQKLIFSCQKREAAILSQHSLSYHLIQL